jgi:hypothetical protein
MQEKNQISRNASVIFGGDSVGVLNKLYKGLDFF